MKVYYKENVDWLFLISGEDGERGIGFNFIRRNLGLTEEEFRESRSYEAQSRS